MTIFLYDKSFEGLLTCVFDAYRLKDFPEQLLMEGEPLPLFCDHHYTIVTDKEKAERVWTGLNKRLSPSAIHEITLCWLSELAYIDLLLFHFMRKVIDSPVNIETNFADSDVLQMAQIYKKVSYEGHRLMQFARFQKTNDGIFFAPLEPLYNTLPLCIAHFRDRFADQRFVIYDMHRHYGYYYDLHTVTEISFADETERFVDGKLNADIADKDELDYQRLWQNYFATIAIKERINPRKQRSDMPVRYWKYLTETKGVESGEWRVEN
jgi:probable DNA metabolism protein